MKYHIIPGFMASVLWLAVLVGNEGQVDLILPVAIVATGIAVILGIVLLGTYSSSMEALTKLQRFYEENKLFYEALDHMLEGLPQRTTERATVIFMSRPFSVREIAQHNTDVAWYREYCNPDLHPFLSKWMPKMREGVQPIEIPEIP